MAKMQHSDGSNTQEPVAVNPQLALQAWLSPAYPVGGYAYSHGLETAAEQGNVCDQVTLRAWIEDNLRYGSGWNDAIILYQTARIHAVSPKQVDFGALKELAELACALTATAELRQESMQQGMAFLDVTERSWPHPDYSVFAGTVRDCSAYPVCFGMAACCHDVEMQAAVCGYLFAMVSTWISAAIRLNLVGQTAGQQLAGAIAPIAESIADMAKDATLDDLGSCCFLNEIASFQHETQQARLFRS